MSKRIGLKDIAKSLNVSVTTVSRALNDKFDINPETRKRILAKAEELNYRRNAYAVSLRKNEYFSIGVILPSIDHYFFSTVLKGIMNKAHMANYLVIVGETTHYIQKEQEIIEQFISHCVSGVIISPSNQNSLTNNLELLRRKRIPYILVDRPSLDVNDSFVKYDDINGGFLATQHLIEQGFKKIAFIKGLDYCVISNARLEGYKKALKKYNLPIDEDLIKTSNHMDGNADGYLYTRQLLLSANKPDAIFTVTDDIATGVYSAAKELKINIPKDLGVVGYSDSKIATHLDPPLTTVEQPGSEMGEQAFDFLQQTIIKNNSQLKRIFEARLIIRESSLKSAKLKVHKQHSN